MKPAQKTAFEKNVFDRPRCLKDARFHYCPGCHHGTIHRVVAECIDKLELREKSVGVAPVGCAVLLYDYLDLDIVEAPHGRAPALATGIKRALPDRFVFTYQGDGDLASIGASEIVHAANRGENISVVFVNNTTYGMTGGQMAPTTLLGQKTSTSPYGRDFRSEGYPIRIAELLAGPLNRHGRVGVRLLPVGHARFEDVATIVLGAAVAPAYLMLPKPQGLAEVERAAQAVDALGGAAVPLHALIETHGALREVFAIAAHPRIESLSFGLMDFVAAHRGAIPASAMSAKGQFEHPLVVRAKLEIAAACHAHAKVPSHSVVTEFKDEKAVQAAAEAACRRLGYTRMWSIHPAQIRPIVDAFAPTTAEVDLAVEIIGAAQAAGWAPIRHRDTLHDRASYRFFWQVIERAQRTSFHGGPQLPAELRQTWFA